MSRYMPRAAVQREIFMQTTRVVQGLKSGTYTRFKDEQGRVGTIKTDRIESVSEQLGIKLTPITQDEYEALLRAPAKPVEETTNEQA